MRQPVTHHTVPDLETLWLAATVAARALDHETRHPTAYHMSWRITADDWNHIRQIAPLKIPGSVQLEPFPPRGGKLIYLLFGHPVTVVAPEPARWPELVISIDRRNGS